MRIPRTIRPFLARQSWFAFGSAIAISVVSHAQAPSEPTGGAVASAASEAQDRGWPRDFEAEGHVVRIHQPQLEAWPNFGRIQFRAAFSVMPKGGAERTYGVIRCSADTEVAVDARLVVLTKRAIEGISFPDVEAAEAERLSAIVRAAMPPERPQTISLDRLIAEMGTQEFTVRRTEVSIAPPKILASDVPAILVVFLGKPRFQPVPGSELLFAVNTNWDLFLDPSTKTHYLLNGQSWLVSRDLEKGPWSPAATLPAALSRLPTDENWADVRAAVPGVPARAAPAVFVTREPAELVVTIGAPQMEPIAGTNLMLVSNSENDLFYHTLDRHYYLLAAGRWFRAAALAGPWSAASADVPGDFKLIPEESAVGDVLASVPGTPQANEAALLASIPRKATITRTAVSLTVTYNGPPDFRKIDGTIVRYAHNSPDSVFLVEGKYYCCRDAIWFVAASPTGAWEVCDAVPKAIYTIPATSPHYNVTYVTVYESTPTTVVTGYTAGYSGATVAATGVVMFGLGLLVAEAIDDDDCCWGYHYRANYFSYGCGAFYLGGHGGYVCGVRHYGPYGGAGRWAMYNPATGVYSRGGYVYGPNGAAGYRAAYNPSTGIAGARAGGTNIYGSWGRGVVTNGDEWVRGGYRSGERGTIGGVQGSEGAGAVRVEGRFGNGVTVVRDRDGDVYAGKDGKVYRRSSEGWNEARPTTPEPKRPADAARPPTQAGDLQRDAANRERGERNAKRAEQFQRSGGRRRR